jgi:hypothetical protein
MLEATRRNILHIAHNRKYWCLFFLFLPVNFVIHVSLVEPGLILAQDFTRSVDFNRYISSHLYPMWDEHGQRSNLLALSQLDLYTPAVILSSVIDIPNTVVYLAYLVVLGSLSGVFTFKLAEYVMVRMKLKPRFEFAIVSSLFFMFATFVVGTAFHPGIAFSFYLSPLLFYLVIKGVEEDRISYLLLSSVIYALVAHQLHFVVFGLIIILSYIVYDLLYRILVQRFRSFSSLKRAAWYTLIIIGPFIALNSYWLIPNFAFSGIELNPNLIVEETPELLYRNSNIMNVFSVKADFNLYSIYPYSESELAYMNILSITLTVIAVSSLVLYKPNKLLIYLGIFLVLSVIISVVPFYLPDLYNWLIFEMPGSSFYFWVLRAPKFFDFMNIPISIMLSLSSFRIYQILLNRQKRRQLSKAVARIFLAVVLVFSLVPNYILLTGDFNGLHRTYALPQDYKDMLTYLEQQEDDVGNYKSIWGPRYGGSNSSWSNNSIGRLEEQISPINTFSGAQTLNNYIYPVIFGMRFPFGSMVYDGQTNNLNEFLSPLNVKYIVLHDDIPSLKNRIDKLSTALNNQKGLLLESTQFRPDSTYIYTIKEPAGQFSIKQNTMLIQGGGLLRFDSAFRTEDVIVNSSSSNTNRNNTEPTALSNSIGVFFSDMSLEQNPEMWNLSDTLIPEKELSYAEYMLDKNDVIVIPTSAYINNYAPLELWSQTSMSRPSFSYELHIRGIETPYQFDYGKNIVFTSANNSILAIPISLSEAGKEYKVLLRYFANEKGGLLDFNLGGKSIELETKSNVNRFVWADLGTLASSNEQGTQTVSIENRNGFNALNLIAVVPAEKYEQYKAEFINSLHNKDIIHIFEAESDFNFFDRTGVSRDRPGLSRVVSDVDYSNGMALELRSTRQIASTEFEILKDGKYNLAVYGNGTITAYIDGVTSRTINLTEGIPHIESLELNSGNHFIEITQAANSTNFSYLDFISIDLIKNDDNNGIRQSSSSLEQQQQPVEESIVTYQKIDATTYEVTVKAESPSSPFMLAFAEAYDERWRAEVEEISSTDTKKKIYKPLPLYGAINGFNIDTEGLEGGEYVIHINYAPQELFYIGAWMSGFSYAGVIVYLLRTHLLKFPLNRSTNSR